jgi:hypothetical protein
MTEASNVTTEATEPNVVATPVADEIKAINTAYEALAALDADSKKRAMGWLGAKFKLGGYYG